MKSIMDDFDAIGSRLRELEGDKAYTKPSGASRLCPTCNGHGKYQSGTVCGIPIMEPCPHCAPLEPVTRAAPAPQRLCHVCLGSGGGPGKPPCPNCNGRGAVSGPSFQDVLDSLPKASHRQTTLHCPSCDGHAVHTSKFDPNEHLCKDCGYYFRTSP